MRALPHNLREVVALETTLELPILLLTCGEIKEDTDHQKYLQGHLEKLGEHTVHMSVDGSAHSNIYWQRDYRKAICQEVDAFLKSMHNHRTE